MKMNEMGKSVNEMGKSVNDMGKAVVWIPANPGYFAIYKNEEGGLEVGEPVVAWGIDEFHSLWTMTLFEVAEATSNFFGSLTPSGLVVTFEQTFASLELAAKAQGPKPA